jgi:CcmD family protein
MNNVSDLLALALVNGLIWAGIFFYLLRLSAKVKQLEKEKVNE